MLIITVGGVVNYLLLGIILGELSWLKDQRKILSRRTLLGREK